MTLSPDGLPLTGILGDTPAEAWASDLNQLVFKGNPLLSEVLFLHKEGRTLMLDDLIQANPPIDGMPIRNALFRLSGGLAPEGGVGLDMRWTFTDRRLARQSLEQVLEDALNRIRKASEDVQQAFHALSQQLYSQGQPQAQAQGQGPMGGMGGQSGQQGGGHNDDGDVIEGEVKE